MFICVNLYYPSETQTKRRLSYLCEGRNFWTRSTRYFLNLATVQWGHNRSNLKQVDSQFEAKRSKKSKSFSEGDWDCWARTDAEKRNLLIWKVFICTGFLIQIQYRFVKSDFSIAFICHYPFVLHSKNHSRSACHLQLGRDLYDRKKFGKEVFSSSSLHQWFWFLNEKIWVEIVLW